MNKINSDDSPEYKIDQDKDRYHIKGLKNDIHF